MGILRKKQNDEPAVAVPAVVAAVAHEPIKSSQGWNVLLHPHVSEKATERSNDGQYIMVVAMHATKHTVARAVAAQYGVMPVSVNMMRVRGKYVRTGQRGGKRKNWKKAMITLPKGKKIHLYEGV